MTRWRKQPKDDAWKQAHLAMVEGLGKRLSLHCDGCQHVAYIEPRVLAERHGLNMQTPMLMISWALVCTRCGERKGCCGLEPHRC